MSDASGDDRLLALARRLLSGEAIDWEKEGVAEKEVRDGMKHLQKILGRPGLSTETWQGPASETHARSPRGSATPERDDRFIGDFRIVRKLGEGGMGVVYEAEQQHPRRAVALKVVRGGAHVSADTLKLFRREIQTLALLSHSGIAQLYEAGITEGMPFFAMELIRGEPLSEWLRSRPKGPMSPVAVKLRLALFRKICDAVAYAHQRGVIHRDLKPGNVLIPTPSAGTSTQDGVPDVKVLDFGLARITDSDVQATTFITEMGKVQGTLPYMSPEQVRGNPDAIDLRTDIYSLGVILYEMIAGRLPYDLSNAQLHEAVRIICDAAPRSLTLTYSGTRRLDADVATIVAKCLEKEAERRYQSATAVSDDVQRYLAHQPILARPPSAAYQFRKLVMRHKGPFAAAALAFVLLAAFATAMTVQAARIAKERDRANQEAETSHRVSSFLQELLQVSNPEATRSKEITTKEMLDNAAQQLDIELKDEPKIRARVMSTLVDVYRGLEMHDAAESLGQRTLTLVESIFGANSLEYAGALDDIGGHENDVRAQEIRSKLLAPDDIRLAQGLYDLGMDAIGRDLPGGEATLLRGLVLTEHARLPAEKKTRLWILTALGVARAKAQDYRAAADYLRQALVIREEIFHPNHRDRIWGLFDLGTVLTLAGELAEARPYLESAFTISKRAFGPNNRTVGGAASSLGDLERREGHLDRARMLLEEAVGILESTNPDDGWMGDTLFSLALVDEGQGRLGEAVDRMGRSRKIWAKAPGVLDPCPEYARLLRKAGRITEAEKVEAEMKSAEPKP